MRMRTGFDERDRRAGVCVGLPAGLLDLLLRGGEHLDGLGDEAGLAGFLVIDPPAHEHDLIDRERGLVL